MKQLTIGLGLISLLPMHTIHANKRAGENKPNIIFLISDDQSTPFLGCFGNKDIKTPNLDKFASEGMAFSRTYTTAPQSAPSRSSFFTGRSPVSTTMSMFSLPLPGDVVTYPDILKKNGYFIGVTARSHHQDGLGRNKEIKDAIEHYDLKTFSKRFNYAKTSGQPFPELVSFLDSCKNNRPFFVQVSFYDPHRPWDRNAIPIPHDPKTIKLPIHYPDNELIREDFARHYDEIARMDTDFGKMMTELEKRGLKDNTIIVFVGDNGSALLRGKGTLYELGINVPLIVRWPGKIKAGVMNNDLISGEDFAPTLLELAGLKTIPEMTGVSFANTLLGKPQEKRKYVFSERAAHAEDLPVTTKDFDLVRCVITSKYKLIYNATRKLDYWPVDFSYEPFWIKMAEENRRGIIDPEIKRLYFSERQMFELYDLETDPQELTNLIGRSEYVGIEKDLRKQLGNKMLLDRDYVPLPYYSLDAEYK